jgi:hypothetical protein
MSSLDPTKAPPHPAPADHPATADARSVQPAIGQLWRSSTGSVYRVTSIDLSLTGDCVSLALVEASPLLLTSSLTRAVNLLWFEVATFIRPTFRAGDHIHHAPTGEDWLLAADERDGRVICCAWPEALGNASDCTLVRAVSDEDHVKVLRAVAEHDGLRGVWARRDLARLVAKGEA